MIVDSHAHVFDLDRFPLAPGQGYHPRGEEAGTTTQFLATLDAHGVAQALLVQPSGYGFDNRAVLAAMAAHPGRFRAILVADFDTPAETLDGWARAGAVGLRFNMVSHRPDALSDPRAPALLARLAGMGWFVQVFADDAQWPRIAPLLRGAGVRVLVDHFGVHDLDAGTANPGFQAVLALGRDGRSAVKLSGMFRTAPARLAPFADALIAAFGLDNCVWGSDWPFINMPRRPSYAEALAALDGAVPDAAARARIAGPNAVPLFGFAQETTR